jgi:hypothetical protein
VKDKVDDSHLNFKQLDVPVGVIGLVFREIGVPARTARWFEGLHLAGFQPSLPMPLVAFFATGLFVLWLGFGFFLVGGRRWLAADWNLTSFASYGFPVHRCVGSGDGWFHPARQFPDAAMGYWLLELVLGHCQSINYLKS